MREKKDELEQTSVKEPQTRIPTLIAMCEPYRGAAGRGVASILRPGASTRAVKCRRSPRSSRSSRPECSLEVLCSAVSRSPLSFHTFGPHVAVCVDICVCSSLTLVFSNSSFFPQVCFFALALSSRPPPRRALSSRYVTYCASTRPASQHSTRQVRRRRTFSECIPSAFR